MSTPELIAERVRLLPPKKQQEVLDLVEFLLARVRGSRRRVSAEGLCADPGTDISAEEISRARREMWGNFPREDM
ncbi:MAG: hypothetical protein AB1714_25675 [Acidobacteriota bacterium]